MLTDWSGSAPPALAAIVGAFLGTMILFLVGSTIMDRH